MPRRINPAGRRVSSVTCPAGRATRRCSPPPLRRAAGEPVEKWSYPPYGGVVDKGAPVGRGATDNKSGVLAFTKGARRGWLNARRSAGERQSSSPRGGGDRLDPPRPLIEANRNWCAPMPCTASTAASTPVPWCRTSTSASKSVLFVGWSPRRQCRHPQPQARRAASPAWDLVSALNTMMDANRRIPHRRLLRRGAVGTG